MGAILCGTASWTDRTLVECGRFYPKDVTSAEDRLRYYASRFATVEVDSSYYALPSARNAQLWAERTGEGFLFVVKAYRVFTGHQTPPESLPNDIREALGPVTKKNVYYKDLPEELARELWARFRTALKPLQSANKLSAVLFQFPPWFVRSRASIGHIQRCAEMLPDYALAVEFRNHTWLDDAHRQGVLEFERENRLAHVIVDEPQGFKSSIPWVAEVTHSDLALVRLHGRNSDTWEAKGLSTSGERFNYLYAEEELLDLGERIKQVAAQARRTHVFFNNNYQDYGVRNALRLSEMLGV